MSGSDGRNLLTALPKIRDDAMDLALQRRMEDEAYKAFIVPHLKIS